MHHFVNKKSEKWLLSTENKIIGNYRIIITNYHHKMNAASQYLCVVNPGLLKNRVLLIEKAREKIMADGFEFAKRKSRSKKGLESTKTDHQKGDGSQWKLEVEGSMTSKKTTKT